MKIRSSLPGLWLSTLCLISACSKPHFDILLDGPWILYEEKQFDDHGHNVPALIAIAPLDDVAPMQPAPPSPVGKEDPMDPSKALFHHQPQVSTGDGYVFPQKGIYCLTLDDACAPKGPVDFHWNGYPRPSPLQVHSVAHWGWASTGANVVALILPMPDSYSNDGVWWVRFANKFEGPYGDKQLRSIGLQLHYDKNVSWFNLSLCDQNPPSVQHCHKAPDFPTSTKLANTGTLRIEMKAPDIDDACDQHVRYAYMQAYKNVLPHPGNEGLAVIEPAQGLKKNGDPQFEDSTSQCHLDDPQNPKNQKPKPAAILDNVPSSASATLKAALSDLKKYLTGIQFPLLDEKGDLRAAASDAKAAVTAAEGLDFQFPRISALQRIGASVRSSEAALDRYQNENGEKAGAFPRADIEQFRTHLKAAESFTSKQGNDCRAEVTMVGPS